MSKLDIYKSISKSKKPNDDLVESECARFKASGADFGIVSLIEIKRWMTISPVLQFGFFKTEKEVMDEMEKHKKTLEGAFFATTKNNEEVVEHSPPEILENIISTIKKKIPNNFPGRIPTMSVIDNDGGCWSSNQSKFTSSLEPVFCPTARFDLKIPEIYYSLSNKNTKETEISPDTASHAYFFAGLEFLGGVLSVPIRPKSEENIAIITDGNLLLNDLHVSDFILGQVLDEGLWKDKNSPFVVSFGTTNTNVFCRKPEQILELLENDFFVSY